MSFQLRAGRYVRPIGCPPTYWQANDLTLGRGALRLPALPMLRLGNLSQERVQAAPLPGLDNRDVLAVPAGKVPGPAHTGTLIMPFRLVLLARAQAYHVIDAGPAVARHVPLFYSELKHKHLGE